MKFSYYLIRDQGGYVAECVESEVAGEGKSGPEAVASLRKSLEERMFRPDAVAPPSERAEGTIELVLADDRPTGDDYKNEKKVIDFGGPGEAAPPPAVRH